MSLKSLYQNLKNKFSGDKPADEVTREDGSPMPPIQPGKVLPGWLRRKIMFARRGKDRRYRRRQVPYMGSYRALRQHQIRMSQLQGIEVANALREARKGGRAAVHQFLLRNYPMSNHNARA